MDDNTVRRRADASTPQSPKDESSDPQSPPKTRQKIDKKPPSRAGGGVGIMTILRVVGGLALLSSAMSWFITGDSVLWGWKPWFFSMSAMESWLRGPIFLTDLELAAYDGTNPELPLLVGLNGSIYDVSASPSTYGPEGSYHFFVGKDAARAFITGCFQEDLTPDLRGVEDMYIPVETEATVNSLSKGGLKIKRERERRLAKKKVSGSIDHWAKVFRGETGRPYFYVGEITREEGWLEKLPKRTLCAAAEEARPKDEAVDT